MADLEILPFGEGYDRNEPILVGSSDDEDDHIEQRRLRRLGGHQGTPIPRRALAPRIFSPPPPVPQHPFNLLQAIPYLEGLGHAELMRMFLAERVNVPRPIVRTQPPDPEPYDVRMTHAGAKPRLGFTFDFEQPEEEEKPLVPKRRNVKYKQTIEIPDSPPLRADKGKAKAVEELDLDRNKEIIEIYSDDEELESVPSSSQPVAPVTKLVSVLICAGCRKPLRTGGDRLWALRCGHMIDSRCYLALSRPVYSSLSLLSRLDSPAPKRRKTGKEKAKGKGKGKGIMESHDWACPVKDCAKIHKSERMAGEEDWVPAKDSGAIKVFI